MKRNTKIILAGVAVVIVAGGAALANQGWKMHKGKQAAIEFLKAADLDKDDALTLTEINTAISSRFTGADGDGDKALSKVELITAVENLGEMPFLKRRSGGIADRVVYRMDLNEDGVVALSEIENRVAKFFAVVDRDDDGKVVMEEVRRLRGMGHGKRRGHHRRWGNWGSGGDNRQKDG